MRTDLEQQPPRAPLSIWCFCIKILDQGVEYQEARPSLAYQDPVRLRTGTVKRLLDW